MHDIDFDIVTLDFDSDQITQDILPTLMGEEKKMSPPSPGTECYFCGPGWVASSRTAEGHPICSKCKNQGIPV